MKSRLGQHATQGNRSLSEAFAAESVDKLTGYYLPWIRETLEAIDDEITWRRPRPGVNSIGNLLLHLEGNLRQWIIVGLGGADDERDRAGEFARDDGPGRWELFATLEATVEQACGIIQAPRSDEDWLSAVTIQGFSTTPVSAVVHVVEHMAYHTGQIVMLAKAATGRDFRFYNL